jgi:hypothetical protein
MHESEEQKKMLPRLMAELDSEELIAEIEAAVESMAVDTESLIEGEIGRL